MVPEAVIVVLRLVILVLLWGFVLAAVVAVRHDIFGGRRVTPAPPRPAAPSPPPPRRQPTPTAATAPVAAGRPQRLVVVEGPLAGTSVPLAGASITIGRAKNSTLTLPDDYASTRHARLTPRGDGWVVEDLGSTNGTFVGRTRVREATPVAPGTPLRIGRTVLELRS